MATDEASLLEIGRITKPHGLQGEVLVSLTTTETSRLAPGAVLRAGDRELVVLRSQVHGQRWIVEFDGLASREAAESVQGTVLRAEPKSSADDGDDDALWVHELIGTSVIDLDGRALGQIVTVHDNPASDLLELDSGALVPLRFVVGGIEHGPDGPTLRIDPPEGLLSD
jgi:16S rRNA processing protein RimM